MEKKNFKLTIQQLEYAENYMKMTTVQKEHEFTPRGAVSYEELEFNVKRKRWNYHLEISNMLSLMSLAVEQNNRAWFEELSKRYNKARSALDKYAQENKAQ